MIDQNLDAPHGLSLAPSERDDTCILDEYHPLGRTLILDAQSRTEIIHFLSTAGQRMTKLEARHY